MLNADCCCCGLCRSPIKSQKNRDLAGEMAEWLKAHAWKACIRETVSWVRIPLSPPGFQSLTAVKDAALLSPMFLEILQNFIKFFSYETVRIIFEPAPYSATIPISTTSQNVVFSLMWPSQATLRLTIVPPGGTQPIVKESASGLISVVQAFRRRSKHQRCQPQTGLPFSSRSTSVSLPFTTSRARIRSASPCLILEPVRAISSPLLKLNPMSARKVWGHR